MYTAKAEAKANAAYKAGELRRLFQESLPRNTAWRLKSFLLYGTDPLGEFASTTRPKRGSKNFGPGPGLDYKSAVYHFGKEALEGIQYGLVKKGSKVTVDSLMHEWGLDSADAIYDALHFNKAKAQEQFIEGGWSGMLYQSALMDKARAHRALAAEARGWGADVQVLYPLKVGDKLSVLLIVAHEREGKTAVVDGVEIYDVIKEKRPARHTEPEGLARPAGQGVSVMPIKQMLSGVKDADGNAYFQDAAPGSSAFSVRAAKEARPRAGIRFLDDGRAIIHLFQTANASSIIHESGHILRRMLPERDQADVIIKTQVEAVRA